MTNKFEVVATYGGGFILTIGCSDENSVQATIDNLDQSVLIDHGNHQEMIYLRNVKVKKNGTFTDFNDLVTTPRFNDLRW